jgi:GNAT superfamily N-acetyltransferase
MILWTRAFQNEIGESAADTELRVDSGLAARQLWLWDQNGETTSMAVGREPVLGVVRLSGVYTPPEKRKHGYAAACVHALSKHFAVQGIGAFSIPTWVTPHRIPFTDELGIGPLPRLLVIALSNPANAAARVSKLPAVWSAIVTNSLKPGKRTLTGN